MRRMDEARGKMTGVTRTLTGLLVAAMTATGAGAQTDGTVHAPSADVYKTIYLSTVTQQNDANEIVSAMRNMLDTNVKIFLVPSQNAITLRANAAQMGIAERLLTELDRPRKTYRLTYTITDLDAATRIGVQHFSMIVVSGGKTQMKQGSKIPVVTGTYNPGTANAESQFTYLDIGMSFDASVDESVNGVRLRTKVERSSVGESKDLVGVHEPIVRQAVLEGTSILTPGKPLVLGSLDLPESTRHLEVEVELEVVR